MRLRQQQVKSEIGNNYPIDIISNFVRIVNSQILQVDRFGRYLFLH